MRRLIVSFSALLLSVTVAFGSPGNRGAAQPPPCPSYDTFVFCERFRCPIDVSDYCLEQVGFPANCRVEQPFCYDVGYPPGCFAWNDVYRDYRYEVVCPYVPAIP